MTAIPAVFWHENVDFCSKVYGLLLPPGGDLQVVLQSQYFD